MLERARPGADGVRFAKTKPSWWLGAGDWWLVEFAKNEATFRELVGGWVAQNEFYVFRDACL